MSEGEKPFYLIKICLLGQGGVGKTCIAKRLCFDTFDANTKLTIGLDFYTYDLPIIVESKEVILRLSLWDFGGQEQFKKFFTYYIGGANGIFMVFSLIDIQTLITLDWWYEKLIEESHQSTPKIVLGTKNDLINEQDEKIHMNNLVINQFMKKHNEIGSIQKTSSKLNYNIIDCFKELSKRVLDYNKLDYDRFL